MLKNNFRKLTCSILIIALLFVSSFSNNVYADQQYTASVIQVVQTKTNWCWAACGEMISSHFLANRRTQTQIVNYVMGSSLPNNMATPAQMLSAIRFATNYLQTYQYTQAQIGFSGIETNIQYGYPVAANVFQHVVVVCHTLSISNSYFYVSVVDPIDGILYTTTYSAFVAGSWVPSPGYQPYLFTYHKM